MEADDLKQALIADLEETGLPWISAVVGRARAELLEDQLFLVFREGDRYAFCGARQWRVELVAALRAIAPGIPLRIHHQNEAELYGL